MVSESWNSEFLKQSRQFYLVLCGGVWFVWLCKGGRWRAWKLRGTRNEWFLNLIFFWNWIFTMWIVRMYSEILLFLIWIYFMISTIMFIMNYKWMNTLQNLQGKNWVVCISRIKYIFIHVLTNKKSLSKSIVNTFSHGNELFWEQIV